MKLNISWNRWKGALTYGDGEIVLLIEIEIANYCQSKSPTENNWTDLSNGDLSRLINNFSNDKCQNYRN